MKGERGDMGYKGIKGDSPRPNVLPYVSLLK